MLIFALPALMVPVRAMLPPNVPVANGPPVRMPSTNTIDPGAKAAGVAELIDTVPAVFADVLMAPTLTPLPINVILPPVPLEAFALVLILPRFMNPVATAVTLPPDTNAPVALVLILTLDKLMLPGDAAVVCKL